MNPLRRLVQTTAVLGLLALGATAPAQTQGYAQKTKNVKVGVLLLDGDKPPAKGFVYGQTAAPYAFYNLDQATSVKPDGWTFTNPYAPGAVTPEIRARYAEIYNQSVTLPPPPSDTFPVPVEGEPINKRNGAYWTVRLTGLSEAQIANYDVLLIAPRFGLSLNSTEREKLRRFVDGGGVLWVDLNGIKSFGGVIDPQNNLPFAVAAPNTGAAWAYQDATNPLLSGVRQVSGSDLYYLNSGTTNAFLTAVGGDANNVPQIEEFGRYRGVAFDANQQPLIAEARLGDGTIVVTARGAAELLNRSTATTIVGDPPAANSNVGRNIGYEALTYGGVPAFNAAGRAAARLAINIASMGGNFRQTGGGTRKTNSATADPGSPVLPRFTIEGAHGPNNEITGTPNGTPVTYKGYLIASIGDRIAVYDAIPGRDLDGDGDPDDGIVNSAGAVDNTLRDVSVGKTLDLVWYSGSLGSTLSSAVCAEVPETKNGLHPDQVLVTDTTGTLYAFDLAQFVGTARQAVGGRHAFLYKVAPSSANGGASDATQPPLAPVVHNGLAYIADTVQSNLALAKVGRVWVVDLSSGKAMATDPLKAQPPSDATWVVGGPNAGGGQLLQLTASPTIGEIAINDNSGGSDRVMYVPGVNTAGQPGFVSLWLGAKGENPDNWTIDATGPNPVLRITTRAGAANQLPIFHPELLLDPTAVQNQMGVHLSVQDANGTPLPLSRVVKGGPLDGGPGTINYLLNTSDTEQQLRDAGISFRIDYTIDWGLSPTAYSGSIQRGSLLLPVRTSPTVDNGKRILGPIAMTARGTLHMIEGTPRGNDGGSYFAIREDAGGRGQFRVVSRYTLYSQYSQTFGAGVGTTVPQVLEDADAVQSYFPTGIRNDPSFRAFRQFGFAGDERTGGVAIRNGIAYTAINATRGPGIPVTMVAAFRAEPETPELRIGSTMSPTPVLQQADWARSDPTSLVRTPVQSRLAGDRLNVDTENGIIRIENLATVVRGQITDCLSLSQPVGVGGANGGAFALRQPDAVGDRWSPLLWFGLWNGGTATAAPLVAGNEVFLPARTFLKKVLNGDTFNPSDPNDYSGVLWSVDADISTNNVYSVPLPGRPWIIQQAQISNNGTFLVSPYYRMPQNRGVATIDDWKLRLNQTVLGTSHTVLGVGGGDGVVAAYSDTGLYGLSRANFLVCDEGRLLAVDSSGNPLLNTFGGRFNGIGNGGAVSNQRNLVRPVKAYPVGTTDTLVVDAGANRIMRIDEDGTVQRSLDRILLDPNFKPTNYRVNEPLTFKDPRDATTFEGYVYLQKGADGKDAPVVSQQQPIEYWVRYLIADAGNGRLVELADRFQVDSATGRIGAPITLSIKDPEIKVDNTPGNFVVTNQAQVGVLVWQSPSLEQSAQVGDYYNSVSRVFLGTVGSGRYVYVAGVSRSRPTPASVGMDNPGADLTLPRPSGSGGGAVVVFDPLGGTRVFDRFTTRDLSNVDFLANPQTGTFGKTKASTPAQTRPFTNLVAVTASAAVNTNVAANPVSVRVMVTDVDAVYEFYLDSAILANPNQSFGGTLQPTWMINEAAYLALRPDNSYGNNALQFRPAYARRLDSGDVIVVNGYRGLTLDRASAYTGEVALMDGTPNVTGTIARNLGFTLSSVRFELPPLEGVRGLVSPVFADRR